MTEFYLGIHLVVTFWLNFNLGFNIEHPANAQTQTSVADGCKMLVISAADADQYLSIRITAD